MTDFSFSSSNHTITLVDGTKLSLDDPRAFKVISDAWIEQVGTLNTFTDSAG